MPVNPTKSHLDYYYNIICYHKPSFLQFIAVALTFNVPAEGHNNFWSNPVAFELQRSKKNIDTFICCVLLFFFSLLSLDCARKGDSGRRRPSVSGKAAGQKTFHRCRCYLGLLLAGAQINSHLRVLIC